MTREVANHKWVLEAWRQKATLASGLLTITSLSLAHYAGFMMAVPMQILAIAGLPLAKGVTATFLFYLFLCAAISRVFTAISLAIFGPFLVAALLPRIIGKRNPGWREKKQFVMTHRQMLRKEVIFSQLIHALLFPFLVVSLYVQRTTTLHSATLFSLAATLLLVAFLIRSEFLLQLKWKPFIRKVKTRPRVGGRTGSAAFVTLVTTLIVASFFLGKWRMELLQSQNPGETVTTSFSGAATLLASSDRSILLYQKEGDAERYIYSSPEFTTSFESRAGVFSPMNRHEAPTFLGK